MIDHLGIEVPASLFEATVDWYEITLAPLGYRKAFTFSGGSLVGFRDINGSVDWWISRCDDPTVEYVNFATHVAFYARDRMAVNNFHTMGIAAGGKNGEAPSVKTNYHAHYYSAFMFDPVGNKIEAVCHAPEMAF